MKTSPVTIFRMTVVPALILAYMAGFLSSCHKTGLLTDMPNSPISFYNASEYLQNQLKISNGGASCNILIDTPDTTSRPDGSPTTSIPYFANDNYHLYQCPNLSSPWISYIRIPSGLHSVVLSDTSKAQHPLAFNRITTVPGEPMTIYYADSLGRFRTWTLIDTVTVSDDNIGIRVMDFSPDAGSVFFTINNQPPAGFPDSLHYGQVSSFVRWPTPVADTLQLRFYNAGDSTDIVAIAFLDASPGHAYNLLLHGYQYAHNYPDPVTGQSLPFNPDMQAVITQNK